jgi:hypothetical protein
MSAQGPHNVHLVPPTLCSIVVQCLSAFLRRLHNLHNLFLHELHRVQAKHLFCKQNPAAQGARALTYILRIWSAALQGAATPGRVEKMTQSEWLQGQGIGRSSRAPFERSRRVPCGEASRKAGCRKSDRDSRGCRCLRDDGHPHRLPKRSDQSAAAFVFRFFREGDRQPVARDGCIFLHCTFFTSPTNALGLKQ